MPPRILVLPFLLAAVPLASPAGPSPSSVATQTAASQHYVEPDFDHPLFDVSQLNLEADRAAQMAGTLIRVAYFLSDDPMASAKAIALAHSLVPHHSGALVANFRLRGGRGPDEIMMIDLDEVATELIEGAALILKNNGFERGGQACACLLEIVSRLPLDQPTLLDTKESLRSEIPAANWTLAFPAGPVPSRS